MVAKKTTNFAVINILNKHQSTLVRLQHYITTLHKDPHIPTYGHTTNKFTVVYTNIETTVYEAKEKKNSFITFFQDIRSA